MKKKVLIISITTIIIILILPVVFQKIKQSEKLEINTFGGELYNGSVAGINNCYHNIPIISDEDLTKVQNVRLEYNGGYCEFEYEINKTDLKIRNYMVYNLTIVFDNITFNKNSLIRINKIVLENNNELFEINPNKCEIIDVSNYDINVDKLYYTSTPSKIPFNMNEIPIYLEAYDDIKIENLILTNNDIIVEKTTGNDFTSEFVRSMAKGAKDNLINIQVKQLNDKEKFIQLVTNILVVYKYNDNDYCIISPVNTIYNILDEAKLNEYINMLLEEYN